MKNLLLIACTLIAFGNINAVDRSQELIQAAKTGTLTSAELARWRHEDPSLRGDTALMYAAKSGNIPLVRLLLSIPNFTNPRALNSQAFRWAVAVGNTEMAYLLLNEGAELHADEDQALFLAGARGYTQTLKMLLSSSLPRSPYKQEVISNLLELLASRPKSGHMVELLRDYQKKSQLHARLQQALDARHITQELITELYHHGGLTKEDLDYALWFAASNDDAAGIELLVLNGADIHNGSDAPFIWANGLGNFSATERLLQLSLQPSKQPYCQEFIRSFLTPNISTAMRQLLEQYLTEVQLHRGPECRMY